MKLFLASKANNPQTLKDIDIFVGGLKSKKIGYIPTAANGEGSYGGWQAGDTWKTLKSTKLKSTPLVLEEMKSEDVINQLSQQDIIWLGGGYWGYLMYWLRRHRLDQIIPQMVRQGKFLVGSSVGAGVLSKSLEIAEWWRYEPNEPPEPEIGGSIFPGLGLIDFDIYPHYQEALLPHIKNHYCGNKMYLLKDGEAITVEKDKITILGEERIIGQDQ